MTAPLLVIAHEATRTGGNRVLSTLLRQTRDRLGAPVAVRLLTGGAMAADLRALATVADTDRRPRAVLANSALSAGALLAFEPDVPCAVYVHEDDEALSVLDESCRDAITHRCRRVLCVSAAAADAVHAMGVPSDRIRIVPPVVPSVEIPTASEVDRARRLMRAGPDDHLVVACGEVAWHKGPDLFVDLVGRVLRPDVRFAWVGRRPLGLGRVLERDLLSTRATDRVTWTGEVPDAAPFLRAADLVVSTSRRDAQPLVPLEAALLERPTAGFAVGGVAELGAEGCALTVAYPDTVALASAVCELLDDPRRSAALAAAGSGRARDRQSVETVGREFTLELRELMAEAA